VHEPLPPCRECGGALQRVESMPGHVVCGSGHLYLEREAASERTGRPGARRAPLERVGDEGERRRRS
jgi:predicted nucleic acid-binding Zn ribbon protein